MTVKELIIKLETYDPDITVLIDLQGQADNISEPIIQIRDVEWNGRFAIILPK